MLVHHSVQLIQALADFSRLLKVMISQTRILCHFILALLSSTLMKQLTCNVDIISVISILVWIFSKRNLFQDTGTDASCVLNITCFSSQPLSKSRSISAYCAWFIALLASPYAVLFRTCLYLFLAALHSSVYIRIQFELH